ncbi:MAG TPA: zinc-binding alcohol dehydrogenase [Fimbriimonas sp.]
MAKRLVCLGVGEIGWQNVEDRPLQEGEVKVSNRYGVEKHGTMQAFVKGYANERGRWDAENCLHVAQGVLWGYPIPLGNMQYGEIEESRSDLQPGQTVVYSGAFQERAIVRAEECFVVPGRVPWKTCMLQDPGEFAMGAIRDGHVRLGDKVAVFGLGAIGLLTVQMAKLAGASQVVAVDPLPARREAAIRSGADHVVDAAGEDPGLEVRKLTEMKGVDVAIDFSGARPALQAAIRGVAYGGTVVCGAFPPPYDAGLDFGGEAHMNRPRIVFSRACSDPNPDHPRWDWDRIRREVWRLISMNCLDGEPIVGPVVGWDELEDAYRKIASSPNDTIKLAVRYP